MVIGHSFIGALTITDSRRSAVGNIHKFSTQAYLTDRATLRFRVIGCKVMESEAGVTRLRLISMEDITSLQRPPDLGVGFTADPGENAFFSISCAMFAARVIGAWTQELDFQRF